MENLVMNSFWRDKRVVITGHTGFKGSWLSLWLQHLGAHVIGVSLDPPSQPNLFTVAQVGKHMQSQFADVRDYKQIQTIFSQERPQIIFHMAAQSLVQYSYQYPLETYSTNILGTVNILEAARFCDSVRVIVNVTTDKCYENKEWCWGYRETEALGGYDPYSSSKACAELVTNAYRASFIKPLASVRAGNVIGGGDWGKNRLIPDMVRAFVQKQTALIRYPDAIRPWQYVLEPLGGYLLLAEKLWDNPDFAQAWNFGPQEQDIHPVRYLVDSFIQFWGEEVGWTPDQQRFAHEAQTLKLNIDKAKTALKWYPKLRFEKALQYVVVWYKAWHQQQDMRNFTLGQIEEYMALR